MFLAVGTSAPVQLQPAEKALLFEVLNEWSIRVTVDGLPAGSWQLSRALAAEVAN